MSNSITIYYRKEFISFHNSTTGQKKGKWQTRHDKGLPMSRAGGSRGSDEIDKSAMCIVIGRVMYKLPKNIEKILLFD